MASCEEIITDSEIRDALKQVGLNKLPGLDGLPYEVYLKLSLMFVLIPTDAFSNWFPQGEIPRHVTKGVIILLKKGDKRIWEGLDEYRPINLLYTELKILALVSFAIERSVWLACILPLLLYIITLESLHRKALGVEGQIRVSMESCSIVGYKWRFPCAPMISLCSSYAVITVKRWNRRLLAGSKKSHRPK